MKKTGFLWLVVLMLLLAGISCAAADGEITGISQLNDDSITIGISQGSTAEMVVRDVLPKAHMSYFTDNNTGYLAVTQGKIDAFVFDFNQMRIAISQGLSGVHLLDETLGSTVQIAVGISPVSKIPDLENSINAFISSLRSDGTLDDMFRRWVIDGNDTMPEIQLSSSPSLHLTVGTTGIVPPFSYYKGTELTGYDIEMAHRFAAWLGADVSFKVFDYGGIIPAAVTGNVDCIMANLNITPERREALAFSDILYEEHLGVMVKGDAQESSVPVSDLSSLATLMRGKHIGVQTGTICGPVAEESIPDVRISYFNTAADILAALRAGKIDAWCEEDSIIRFLSIENPELTILDGMLKDSVLGAIFPKTEDGKQLREKYSAFLEELWNNGTMQEIDSIWFGADESRRTVLDYENLPDVNGTLRMAADTTQVPFTYVSNNRVVGYDVDIAARFCEANGYRLEIVQMDFGGILPSVQSGKCDFASSCITITEERAESVDFSSPNYYGGLVMGVWGDALTNEATETLISRMRGKNIGVQTGATFDEIVQQTIPDAKISYYSTYPDLIAALESHKIDAFPGDEPVLRLSAAENSHLTVLDGRLDTFAYGFVLQKAEKGEQLKAEMDAWLESMKASGELEKAVKKWTDLPESEKTVPDYASFPATRGTLHVLTEGLYPPMNYYRGDELVGLEIDLIARFCQDSGYGLVLEAMNFDSILPAIQTGKADIAAAGIAITEERSESVLFSIPYYEGGTMLMALKEETAAAASPEKSPAASGDNAFLSGILDSFNKTFIREDRWRLFTEGIGITLLITVLAVLFGTAMGFGIFMLCRNGNIVANGLTRFCMWLVQGMPMVVLLMILYYVVFGSVAISGIAVAVIGFTLTFSAVVFSLMKMGVGAVDRGQYEAALALGYSNRRTFFKIILPQALPHVMQAYKGEIVSLIKATAIVGYIAVQDLTKMGDIVRSRTYEAFFPLIAVTIIYFVLEGLLSFLVSRISINFNPKHRKSEDILKGVKTSD